MMDAAKTPADVLADVIRVLRENDVPPCSCGRYHVFRADEDTGAFVPVDPCRALVRWQ